MLRGINSQRSLVVMVVVLGMMTGAAFLTGCDSVGPTDAQGTLKVMLTDAPFPFDLVDEANVTIERVELVGDTSRYEVVLEEPKSYNLLELRDGVTAELATADIPAGDYHQLRVVVAEDAQVVMTDGTIWDLKVPSGTQTGIKVLLPEFTIDEDEDVVVVTLDFDVSKSFVVRGNLVGEGFEGFLFKPVIKPLSLEINDEDIAVEDDTTDADTGETEGTAGGAESAGDAQN